MARTGTTFQIRSVDAGELDSWLGLVNRARYWQDDRESLSFDDTLRPTGEPFLRVGAWTADGTLAGVGEARLSEDGSRFEDRAQGLVGVVPAFWRQGLGTRLADEVERFAVANGAKWVEAEVREDNLPVAVPFLVRRGYIELERYRTSIQTPSTIDLAGLDALRSRLGREGIDFAALSAIDSPRVREALYRATVQIWRDMPHEAHVDWQDPPLKTFARMIFEGPAVLLDGFFVAREGDQIVGLSYLMRRPDGDADVGDTGVLQTHRRRGIARVLKMMVTRYAREKGIARVHTDNRTDNTGMLAINRELGFVPAEQVVIFEKTLRP